MTQTQHTPPGPPRTPWTLVKPAKTQEHPDTWRIESADGLLICEEIAFECSHEGREAAANLIVRAVNTHTELVQALTDFVQLVEGKYLVSALGDKNVDIESYEFMKAARAILARARGEQP
jgi:hypothetical protein